ncbi:hypothetical protein [Nocardioides sp. 616]|uniref:hypothetical protein n=1 Tax=Nocardioides sp. 616 TaxID=2268090 RepID=UPI000CE3D6DA|nr:hypothetical protein [Nocardioides sp. 616]
MAEGRRSRRGPLGWATELIAAALLVLMAVSLSTIALDGRPLSAVDEPTHFDNVIQLQHDTYPHRGSLYTQRTVNEWACGVGHEVGPLGKECGDPKLGPELLPMTKYTTGYIHYPTYFVALLAGTKVVHAVDSKVPLIGALRLSSTVILLAGVVACWLLATSLGLGGARKLAVTFAPVAAPGILTYGPMVNPGSAATLCGALVALGGFAWMRSRRWFWGYLAAALLASCVAATASLTVGVFAIVSGVTWLAGLLGVRTMRDWQVRWWHLLLQAVVFLGPVLVWEQVISARATVPDSVVYAVVAVASTTALISGALAELTTLHSPWTDVGALGETDGDLLGTYVRALGYGLPSLVTVLVFGTLALAALGAFGRVRRHLVDASATDAPAADAPAPDGARARLARHWPTWLTGDRLVVVALLFVVFVFPPALRLSNAANFGLDYAIVPRYLISLAPIAVLLAVRQVRGSGVPRVLALISMTTIVGVCLTAW